MDKMPWYLIRTPSIHILAERYGGLVPTVGVLTKPRRKHKPIEVQRPVLGNMVILPWRGPDDYHRVMSDPLSRQPMQMAGQLVLIDDDTIQEFVQRLSTIASPPAKREFAVGDRVGFELEYLAGLEGVVRQLKPDNAFVVAIIGWNLPVTVQGCFLHPIDGINTPVGDPAAA